MPDSLGVNDGDCDTEGVCDRVALSLGDWLGVDDRLGDTEGVEDWEGLLDSVMDNDDVGDCDGVYEAVWLGVGEQTSFRALMSTPPYDESLWNVIPLSIESIDALAKPKPGCGAPEYVLSITSCQ